MPHPAESEFGSANYVAITLQFQVIPPPALVSTAMSVLSTNDVVRDWDRTRGCLLPVTCYCFVPTLCTLFLP